MNRLDIVRAWKDEEYRNSLTEAQRAALPQNPAGVSEMNVSGIERAAGGANLGRSTQTRVCNVSPNRSLMVRACPKTYPLVCRLTVANCPKFTVIGCPKITIVSCPRITATACPPVSLACPQFGPGPVEFYRTSGGPAPRSASARRPSC